MHEREVLDIANTPAKQRELEAAMKDLKQVCEPVKQKKHTKSKKNVKDFARIEMILDALTFGSVIILLLIARIMIG